MAEAGRTCPSCSAEVPSSVVTCPSCGALSLPPAPDIGASIAEQLGRHLGGRYRIERELGQGGMAIVYLAHDFKLKRAVAMKVMRPDIAVLLGAQRFLREIDIAAALQHPGILPLFDSGEAGGLLYYVMPFEEGQTLRARIEAGPLPIAEALRIGQDLADALAYAHEQGIVHRDIKPENVLFLPHGHVAIADFGIARMIAGAGGGGLTTTTVRVGSPLYMSPEHFITGAEVGPRADTYSLGCVVFEMLVGAPPYGGSSYEELQQKHCSAPIPSARKARADVPIAVDLAVRQSLAKLPAERFQNAADFGAALGAPRIEPVVVIREVRKAARRHVKALAATAIVAVAAIVVTLALGRPRAPRAGDGRIGVAVQRFSSLSPALAPQAQSLAEALGGDLSRVPRLNVIYGSGLRSARDTSPQELAGRFGVRHVVQGRMLQSNPPRLALRVLEARSGNAIADTEVVAENDAAILPSLGRLVRRAIGRFNDSIENRARFRSDSAWELFRLSRKKLDLVEDAYVIGAYRQGRQAMAEADSLAAAAAVLEGSSGAGRIAMADHRDHKAFIIEFVRQARPDSGRMLPDPLALHLSAMATVDSLLITDPNNARALRYRGTLKLAALRTDGPDSLLASATRDAERATRLDPGSPTGWIDLADCWSDSGDVDEELFALQRAQEVDVFGLQRPVAMRSMFEANLHSGKSWLAGPLCRDGQREYPGDERFIDCELKYLAYTATTREHGVRALAIVDSLLLRSENETDHALYRLLAAQALARAGLPARALQQLRLVERRTPVSRAPVYILTEMAATRLLLNDRQGAVALARRALTLNPRYRRTVLSDPRFNALRADVETS